MERAAGFFAPVVVYLVLFLLNLLLPGRWVTGYVTKAGGSEKLRYHLNGIPVLLTAVAAWVLLCYSGVLPWDWLWQVRWYSLAGAVTFGLLFSLFIVLPFPAVRSSFLADFYLGRLENPQLWGGRIDAKMWLYLIELNILSFAAHHYLLYGEQSSAGIFLSTALLSFFIVDYLTFEEVHLYTYDLFAERVGFKLGWGCIAFYPFFYSIPIWSTVSLPDTHTPVYLLVLYALVFFAGWGLSRGANLQKYFFKKNPQRSFIGIAPATITGGNRSLLVSGFWGLSRHINYLGEILMAVGIVLSTGHLLTWGWLYPLYYVVLLFPRERDDDKRCAEKYGVLWQQYVQRVPYRIVPRVY
jgi:protein-S-isoprenylcysteine O-methyltransferase Ste14